ncbi:PAS domain S-box protein [Myxococcota bacterium]|nr:PAS domain S-box protein [Myxococcota bacterium]
MEVLVAANIVNSTLALITSLYHFWFFKMRPQRKDIFWAGVICLSAMFYALSILVFYLAPSVWAVYISNKVAYVAVVGATLPIALFAQALNKKPIPGWTRFASLSAFIWLALILGTDQVAGGHYTLEWVSLSPHALYQFNTTSITDLFLLWHIALGFFGLFWLTRYPKTDNKNNRILLVAFGVWALAGIWDALVLTGLAETAPTSFTEYGIIALALALLVRIIREHISLEKAQEKALRASEQSFQELIHKTPEFIVVHREGRFIYVNPAASIYFGYNAEEMIGQPFLSFVHPDDSSSVRERFEQMLRSGEATPAARERFIHKSGEAVVVEVITIPIVFEGQPSFVSIGRNMDKRVKFETRMMQLDRMVALGTLAAGVAHEINNPLSYLTGSLSLANQRLIEMGSIVENLDDPMDREEARTKIRDLIKFQADAKDGSIRIRDIVRDLSDLARNKEQSSEIVNLQELVESTMEMALHEIKHRAQIQTDFQDVRPVQGDRSKIAQVILNLLMNAAQSIPPGRVDENTIKICISQDETHINLVVKDSGQGINPEDLSHVFDPFFTTKEAGEGTGLGLCISHQIVADHGGELSAQSVEGEYASFHVRLPIFSGEIIPENTGSPHEDEDELEALSSKNSGVRSRVLLVDDEVLLLRSLEEMLGQHHDISVAPDAEKALQMLENDHEYDAIICDLMMPQMSGMELYKIISSRWSRLANKTAFLTGGAFTTEAREFVDSLTQPVHLKPPVISDLLQTIDNFAAESD